MQDLKAIDGNNIYRNKKIMNILLKDRTTNKNIIWATMDHADLTYEYSSKSEIVYELISFYGETKRIESRANKEKESQDNRTKKRAEVFTPSAVCNKQNNMIDEQWFGRENVFNIGDTEEWETIETKIEFPEDKNHTWQKYVDARRMEITCGEAPYLVSRYDTVSGCELAVKDRIGLLDRKLRVINENASEEEWFKWVERAYQSTYGFDYQGDNVLLARVNLFLTFIDNCLLKGYEEVPFKWCRRIATIVSWNIWQMDGLEYTVPFEGEKCQQLTLFIQLEEEEVIYCKIKDWRSNKTLEYRELLKG